MSTDGSTPIGSCTGSFARSHGGGSDDPPNEAGRERNMAEVCAPGGESALCLPREPFPGSGRATLIGNSKMNVVPTPTWLSARISPSKSSTICAAIARPSPDPPYSVDVERAACVQGSKSVARLSGGMPTPVSEQRTCRRKARGGIEPSVPRRTGVKGTVTKVSSEDESRVSIGMIVGGS